MGNIEVNKKKIESALQKDIHPDHSLAFEMRRRYRELDQGKSSLIKG